jgi:predicted dehydrogenase
MDSRRTFISNLTRVGGAMALASTRVMGANDRIRLGMIGAGARGTELAPSVKEPNAEFVAFADVYSGRREAAAKIAPAAKFYTDYRALLADRSVDAVIIATPQHLHCEHFAAALDAGKHVYQEKTMAFSVAHAKRMRAARLRAPRLTVQIGHQDCSSNQVADVAGILGAGYAGKITEIHSHMYRNTPHGQAQWKRAIEPGMTAENVAWKAFLGEAPQRAFEANRYRNWRFFWDYSGGNFYENMSHQLAFWYKTLKLGIPTRVSANGGVFLWKDGREVPDTMNASMVHGDDLMFTWDSAFGNNQLGVTEDVLGTDGTISRGERVEYRPQKINRPDGKDILGQGVDSGQRPLDVAHLQNFFDCIRTGRETNCPFDLGFRVSIACRMAVDSYRFGRVLRWDAGKEEIVAL